MPMPGDERTEERFTKMAFFFVNVTPAISFLNSIQSQFIVVIVISCFYGDFLKSHKLLYNPFSYKANNWFLWHTRERLGTWKGKPQMEFVYMNLTKAGRCQGKFENESWFGQGHWICRGNFHLRTAFRDRGCVVALGQHDIEPGWGSLERERAHGGAVGKKKSTTHSRKRVVSVWASGTSDFTADSRHSSKPGLSCLERKWWGLV